MPMLPSSLLSALRSVSGRLVPLVAVEYAMFAMVDGLDIGHSPDHAWECNNNNNDDRDGQQAESCQDKERSVVTAWGSASESQGEWLPS